MTLLMWDLLQHYIELNFKAQENARQHGCGMLFTVRKVLQKMHSSVISSREDATLSLWESISVAPSSTSVGVLPGCTSSVRVIPTIAHSRSPFSIKACSLIIAPSECRQNFLNPCIQKQSPQTHRFTNFKDLSSDKNKFISALTSPLFFYVSFHVQVMFPNMC